MIYVICLITGFLIGAIISKLKMWIGTCTYFVTQLKLKDKKIKELEAKIND